MTDGSGDNVFIQPAGNNHLRPSGFTGGLHAGYNFQIGQWITGVEIDFDYFGLKDDFSATVINPANAHTYTVASSYKSDWLGTVRPRIGYTFDRLLVYAAGGLAATNQRFAQSIVQSPVGVFLNRDRFRRSQQDGLSVAAPNMRYSTTGAYEPNISILIQDRSRLHLPVFAPEPAHALLTLQHTLLA